MSNRRRNFALSSLFLYVLVWIITVIAYFWKGKFDAIFLLGIYTMPSSLVVSEISHVATNHLNVSNDTGVIIDFIGFLVLGGLEYMGIGFIVGTIFEKLFRRF